MKEFDELVSIMNRLRVECPWDRDQNLDTLRKYLMEEAFEVLEALNDYIENEKDENLSHLREELGDLLLQILFQSKILHEKTGSNQLQTLMTDLRDKLVRRHPHIFTNQSKKMSAEEVHLQWNQIKANEKQNTKKKDGHFTELPKHLPSLLLAQKIGEKSAKVKFDWNSAEDAWKDVESEIHELKTATNKRHEEEEYGDLLFSLIQWGRHQKMDPEIALQRANQKFVRRFSSMEEILRNEKPGVSIDSLSYDQKNDLWKKVKQLEKA